MSATIRVAEDDLRAAVVSALMSYFGEPLASEIVFLEYEADHIAADVIARVEAGSFAKPPDCKDS